MNPTTFELERLLRELGTNAGLMALLAFGYSLFGLMAPGTAWPRGRTWRVLASGAMFGATAVLVMMAPLMLGAGITFDTRQVVLALAGAYLPPAGALTAMALAGVYRWSLGGVGLVGGLGLIVLSTGLGMVWRRQRPRFVAADQGGLPVAIWLLSLGLVIAALSLLLAVTLLHAIRGHVLRELLPIAFTVFPAAMVVFGLLIEASRRLRAREAALRTLAEQNAQAAGVFHHSRDAILILDAEDRMIDANPAFCLMSGYTREELLGRSSELMRSGKHDRAFGTAMRRRLEDEGYWEGELWRRRKNGELFLCQVSISWVRRPDGRLGQQLVVANDLTERRRHEEELARAASYDPLTGLPNRRLFTQRLQDAIAQADAEGTRLAVCYLDLDAFKAVNERVSHQAGDDVLVRLADRLRTLMQEGDVLARLGGDEFVVVLCGLRDGDIARQRVQALLARIREPLALPQSEDLLTLSASAGLTYYPDDRADADTLLRHADQAMYAAKDLGKDRWHVFDADRDERLQARRDTLVRIEQAIADGEMELFYQPKVRLSNGSILGAEALIRWRHPERGLLAPGVFLDQILGTPLAQALDAWVLRTGLAQAAAWQRDGLDMPVSVNMTVSTLVGPDFLARVQSLLAQYPGLPRHTLELELLETETMNDLSLVRFIILELDKLGVRVSIDDFGTGYSSLSYLQRLPAQVIKIDQSFVRDMLDNDRDRALVQGIIGLAKAFGRDAVAEGVETSAHAVALGQMGCDILQGYGIARPMPAEALPRWAAEWALPDTFISSAARSEFEALVRRVR